MIEKYQHFDIDSKVIIERIIFHPPLAKATPMSEEACLMYNITGKTKIYSPEQQEVVADDECVLLKCGQYFTTTFEPKKTKPIDAVAVHFYPEVLKKVFANDLPKYISEDTKDEGKAINRIRVSDFLRLYIESILFLFDNPSLVTEELLLLKVKEVILLLLNTDSKEAKKVKKILSNLFSPSKVSLRKVVDAHCYDHLTIEQLAMLCNMSLSTFKRRFTEFYSESPATYIRRKKMEKAAQLLRGSSASIASICYDLGFSDTSNFTKTFKAYFESSPSGYRDKHKLN
mgnify:CR=1 FL=1